MKLSRSIKQKVTLITGAGSGMGKATAEVFAAEGAKVVVTDVNLDNAQEQKVENLNEPVLSKINTPMTLKELEKIAILAGLERANWNMSTTAQQLGISRMTLYRKLNQHGLRKKD